MRAYVTSIGESTEELCIWALERNGFEVVLVKDDETTLWKKLQWIYNTAKDDFLRVDADIIVNRNCTVDSLVEDDAWWVQYQTFDWYKQDVAYGGVQFIKKECFEALRNNIDTFVDAERPESQMFRLDEFYNPRRCISKDKIMGLNGFAQTDIDRVIDTKKRRRQFGSYDFELVERLNKLTLL